MRKVRRTLSVVLKTRTGGTFLGARGGVRLNLFGGGEVGA